MTINDIKEIKKQFEYYKSVAEKTFNQLKDEDFFWRYNDESNSISMIIRHISGNMISRWTDFLTTDGEKANRNRDAEFEEESNSKADLLLIWNKGWDCLYHALDSLNDNDLGKFIYIRNEKQSVSQAIYRQLAHYPYHIGQIVFVGKMLADKNWLSLTIPKGNSQAYNDVKFSQDK